jgi:hypothetical protein
MQNSNSNPLQIIKQYWGWTGIRPQIIHDRNQFGNLIVEDGSGRFWRICPEEFYCKVIAKGARDYKALLEDPEFQQDWQMTALAIVAAGNLGELDGENCFYFTKPGDFSLQNIGVTTIADLIIDSGIAAEEAEKKKEEAKE